MYLTEAIKNLFSNKSNKSSPNALEQGSNFLNTKHNIKLKITPELHLLGETSSPNLNSIVEGLNTMNQSQNTPLQKLDEKEFANLKDLEKKFSTTLSKYVSAYKSYSEAVMKAGGNEKSQINKLKTNLSFINSQLMNISNQMWKKTQNIHTQDAKLQNEINTQRDKLRKQMKNLKKERRLFNRLNTNQNKLEGEIEDNELQVNSAYLHYMVWFIAASTIGVIAVQQALK